MSHELDKYRRMGGIEPGFVPRTEPTNTTTSDIVVDIMERWMESTGHIFPLDAKALALGAGEGHPEMQVLDRLGLNPNNAVFVDSFVKPLTKARLRKSHPGLRTIQSGLFSFLENPTAGDFSLVTAFGIETPLSHPDAMPTLISRLPRVMAPDGIVIILPSGSFDATSHWKQQGFEPLFPITTFRGETSMLAYKLTPQAQR